MRLPEAVAQESGVIEVGPVDPTVVESLAYTIADYGQLMFR